MRGSRPNIVLILTDDQRWDSVWSMPMVQSKLIEKGVTFTNGFVVNPLCCPSRASILTGQYSHSTGVYRNVPPYGGFPSFHDQSTVATWLQGAGYQTALIGKYMNEYKDTTYVPPGWNRWVAVSRGHGVAYFDYKLNVDGELHAFGSDPRDYSTSLFARRAVSFIEEASAPFFLYFAPSAPHTPAVPPPRHQRAFSWLDPWRPESYNEKNVRDKPGWLRKIYRLSSADRHKVDRLRIRQYRTLLGVDDSVGRIVRALRDTGQIENTVIVFMSDNGFLWGEHRLHTKQVAYEESIRVPLVVRFDAMGLDAREDPHQVLNIDLAPTFAKLAGVQPPGVDGRSLLRLLDSSTSTWRRDFLIEHLIDERGIPTYCAVRGRRYAYIRYQSGAEELYNLERDPYELRNRATSADFASVLERYRGRLSELCKPPPPEYVPPELPA